MPWTGPRPQPRCSNCSDDFVSAYEKRCPTCGRIARLPERPAEPESDKAIFYRGWEAGYSFEAAKWTKEGYIAYKGGCDIDAPSVTASTWEGILDAIDDEED